MQVQWGIAWLVSHDERSWLKTKVSLSIIRCWWPDYEEYNEILEKNNVWSNTSAMRYYLTGISWWNILIETQYFVEQMNNICYGSYFPTVHWKPVFISTVTGLDACSTNTWCFVVTHGLEEHTISSSIGCSKLIAATSTSLISK